MLTPKTYIILDIFYLSVPDLQCMYLHAKKAQKCS